jgi:hypothetical protein
VAAGAVEVTGGATADAAATLAAILETDCDAGDVTAAAGVVSDPVPLCCVVDGLVECGIGATDPGPRLARRDGLAPAVEADCADEESADPVSAVSADATPVPVTTAVPTPRAIASAPIRPMCVAALRGQPIGSPLANYGFCGWQTWRREIPGTGSLKLYPHWSQSIQRRSLRPSRGTV